MNLTEPLSETVMIGGKEYPLDLSYDNVLRLHELIADKAIPEEIKFDIGLNMLIDEELTFEWVDKLQIFNELLTAIFGDQEDSMIYDLDGNPIPLKKKKEEIYFSFKHDAEFIYASFMQTYGIDLMEQQGILHWDKFKALLQGLPDGTKLSQVMDIRRRELPSGKDKYSRKEREQLIDLKKRYKLPEED